MSAALHLDMKSELYVTAGRLSLGGCREYLKGLLQSLASKMLEKESGGLPMLLRAAKEAGGHHLVIFLCRSPHHLPPQEADKLYEVLKSYQLEIKTKKGSRSQNPYLPLIFLALQGKL